MTALAARAQAPQDSPSTQAVEPHGFRRLDPLPAPDALAAFYESRYYDLIRRGGRAPELARLIAGGPDAERERHWLASTLHADLAHYLGALAPGRRVLDIGAGTGDLVAFLAGRGFIASGIEPSREAAGHAATRGVAVAQATLEAWAARPEHAGAYDGAVLLNVLEHVPDAEATVRAAAALLAPGGVLAVRVPNDFSDLQAAALAATGAARPWWVCAPDHINYFGPASLASLLAACGLTVKARSADFPMELFLLMGDDYVADPALGKAVHEKRRRMELALPNTLRRTLYEALAQAGLGRNMLVFAAKP